MTDQTAVEPSEPDHPAAWALAQHIADHPVSTVQAAFRYLNAPLTIELHDAPARQAAGQPAAKLPPMDPAAILGIAPDWRAEGRHGPTPEETAADRLVHVGWWCWRGNNHGHLATQACRSDNVPIHVAAEWADDMRVVISRLEEDDEDATPAAGQPAADCPSCEAGIEHTEHCPAPETHNWGCGCLTDVKPASDRNAILAEAANYLCAWGHGEAAAFLLDRIQAADPPTPAVGGQNAGQPAEAPLTAAERQFLTFALDLAADRMACQPDDFDDEDEAAQERLYRLANGRTP